MARRLGVLEHKENYEFSGNPKSFKGKTEISYITALHDAIRSCRTGSVACNLVSSIAYF